MCGDMTSPSPSVSVVLPTLNERSFIRDALDTLAAQDYPEIVEILVVDGRSTDSTRSIARRPTTVPVRVIDNPGVTAAAAMNRGLAAAVGDVIVRADAHAVYAPDYVRRCVDVLLETQATNVGGPMCAVGSTSFGRAVAAVTSSPFGVGPGRFHYATDRHEVETVYLGCWWRKSLESLGGWDENQLQWAAEDQELNYRIRRGGGRIILDGTIRSWYFPRGTWSSLRRQYFNYGMAKASTLAKHKRLPYLRPLVPAALVGGSVVLAALPTRRVGVLPRVSLPATHLAFSGLLAASLATQPGIRIDQAWLATVTCHWWYGAGFLRGLGRLLTGRGFVTNPSGHR